MKSRFIALTCVLAATACAATSGKSTQDPASRYYAASGTTTTTNSRETGATPTSVALRRDAPAAAKHPGHPDQTKSAINTKVNERDRNSSTLTPMDQGNSGSETKITADIRKGIMDDNDLSFTAKNVKVITVGTKVTLRGAVNSRQEKAAIEALAKQTVGVSEIDNQLEVTK